jgi:hypothetical protein
MGALGYVSADASVAVAFVTREPALVVEDFLAVLEAGNPGAREQLASFETEHGVHVKEDLAATLGGDVAFALDGPVLPTPAWKLVVEVYDAPRLVATLEKLVALADAEATKDGKEGVRLVTETSGGRTYHALVRGTSSRPFELTFLDGYMIVAPQRALLDRAALVHSSGTSLARSSKLTALLPADGPLDFSLLAYQDVGSSLASLAKAAGVRSGSSASSLVAAGASIGWGWAEPSRIVFGSSGPGLGDLSALALSPLAFPEPRHPVR